MRTIVKLGMRVCVDGNLHPTLTSDLSLNVKTKFLLVKLGNIYIYCLESYVNPCGAGGGGGGIDAQVNKVNT